jgi:hypothetical protein
MAIQVYQQTTIWGWLVQQALDPTHELLVLAQQIDWEVITMALRPYYAKLGRSVAYLDLADNPSGVQIR